MLIIQKQKLIFRSEQNKNKNKNKIRCSAPAAGVVLLPYSFLVVTDCRF